MAAHKIRTKTTLAATDSFHPIEYRRTFKDAGIFFPFSKLQGARDRLRKGDAAGTARGSCRYTPLGAAIRVEYKEKTRRASPMTSARPAAARARRHAHS
jgi:hypothetical protein